MTRNTILYLIALACFIIGVVTDAVDEQFLISVPGWIAGGLVAYTLTKLFTDKPL